MNRRLHILHLEDEPDFAELVQSLLAQDGLDAQIKRVDNRADFAAALADEMFDAILSDFRLPSFCGLDALGIVREKFPHTPFILVSGAIGERAAIESLKAGATDYVLRQNPDRLPSAIRRAVQEAEERAQRHAAQAEVNRRENYFRALTENSLDVLSILNREGVFTYVSPSVERVLGHAPVELTGQNAFARVHPDDLPPTMEVFQAILDGRQRTAKMEFRFQHKEGDWRHLEMFAQHRLDDADVDGIIAHSRDVTDRRRIEEELRRSEKQYRLLFHENPNPMWVFDLENLKFLEVNEAAIQHYGFSREEFLAMAITDVRPQSGHGHAPSTILEVAGQGRIWRHRRKDGGLMDVEVTWSPMVFRGRFAALTMAADVTERRRSEHQNAVFSKLGHRLSSATTASEAAMIICEASDNLFHWDDFSLDLYSDEKNEIYSLLNITTMNGQRVEIPLSPDPKPANALMHRALTKGAELVSGGVTGENGSSGKNSSSGMLVPVRKGERVIGLLFVQSQMTGASPKSA